MPNTLALAAATRLHPVDLAIVAAYLLGITLFGLQFRKRSSGAPQDKSLKSYFLANNTIPWWAIALSIVSAETSTLTIISVPGLAFAGDFGFLQIAIGYMVGRIVVALLFLPRYFAGEMLTAYQLIDRRFGPALHKVTAGLFLLTRAAAEGVRVFAVSIVVGIAIGTGDTLSIGIISLLTLLYTFEGGMAAVIWTDVVQMIIYVGGTFVAIYTIGTHVGSDGSFLHGWRTIAFFGAPKFHIFNFALNLTQSYTFWAGLLGGTFLTMASHGTDQLMVQRMLAARNLRESRLALLSSGVVIFIQFTLFLLIGVGLWVFYSNFPKVGVWGFDPNNLSSPIHGLSTDRIFPTFIVQNMPIGVAGLLVAAILAAAMSNLSAALNSLSSTTVIDFYAVLFPRSTDNQRNRLAKFSTLFWALVLFGIAVGTASVGGKGHVVEIGLSIASVAYGCLLGVFLLGTLTKFATQIGTTIGMVCGFVLNLWLWQGTFPKQIRSITIPHIAFTWYVLIGAIATFAVGALASLIFRRQSKRTTVAIASALIIFFLSIPQRSGGICISAAAQSPAPNNGPRPSTLGPEAFTPVSALINDAIAAHKLPGAVVVIGHNNKIVFEQAYGLRKIAGEPGLDSKPSAAEPMTEDTIFDMASLTKCLATATAVMQLYEQGKITSFDDAVEKYIPDFNPQHEATRSQVTLRMLLTHTSGEAPDINLKDAWGLAAPDKAEGIHRALTQPLMSTPGVTFRYSDINFILLGALVEKLSGQRLDDYADKNIFLRLGMLSTSYYDEYLTCPDSRPLPYGSLLPEKTGNLICNSTYFRSFPRDKVAPTTHDNEGTATTNPDFDHLLRGTVHDPTTRRMGGVAGHAGVFSTAHDISLFASALLEKLLHDTGPFPLKQSTLQLMTSAQQPGHSSGDITGEPSAQYPSRKDHHVRGFGWDIDSDFSRPRGALFPIGSFGHTGFTGTSLWMDPTTNTYVILLANAIHPRGNPPISHLRGDVATAAAKALRTSSAVGFSCSADCPWNAQLGKTLTGIDILESDHFTDLATYKHLGLLTNQTGLDSTGHRTIDLLASTHKLTRIFSPEHGLFGKQDTTAMSSEKDGTTGLAITNLYGPHDADKRPQHAQLADLDAVVIDLQDAGVRFFTYETVLGYFLEAAAKEKRDFHHSLQIIVLDRPAMLGGLAVQGPVSDTGREDYTNYSPTPVRLGMTFGELARYDNALLEAKEKNAANLTVIPLQGWSRAQFYTDTQLPWTNPSPNLRNITAATLYPGIALLEFTNASVGRGTDAPFELFAAPWLNAATVAATLTARAIPGVTFEATTTTVAEDANHYPFHGQTIPAVRVHLLDRNTLDSAELGIEILSALHTLYPTQFTLDKAIKLIANQSTLDALKRNEDPRSIAATWQPALEAFKAARAKALLY